MAVTTSLTQPTATSVQCTPTLFPLTVTCSVLAVPVKSKVTSKQKLSPLGQERGRTWFCGPGKTLEQALTHVSKQRCTCTHTNTHERMTHMDAHIHNAHTYAYACVHTQTRIQAHARPHTQKQEHNHAHTRMITCSRVHT